MANALQLMAAGFSDSGAGRGGSSGSDQEDDYYRARLQEYLWRLKRQAELEDYQRQEKEAQYLAQTMPGAVDSAMKNIPDITPGQQASMNLLKNAAGIGSPSIINDIGRMLQQAQHGMVQAGVPTDMMQERFQSARDPGFEQYSLRQRHTDPANVLTEERINQLEQTDPERAKRLLQMSNPRDPNVVAEKVAAETSTKADTKAATEGIINAPKTLAQYDALSGQAQTMMDHIDNMRGLMQNNPNVVGWGSYLGYFPETDQRTFADMKQSLISGLAMENIQQLKALSPTGATGFGALSEQELRVLQDSIAKLDQASDPATVRQMLDVVYSKLDKVNQAAVRSYADDVQWFRSNKDLAPRSFREPLEPQNIGDSYRKNRNLIDPSPSTSRNPGSVKWGDL